METKDQNHPTIGSTGSVQTVCCVVIRKCRYIRNNNPNNEKIIFISCIIGNENQNI